jgi:hypothetical protein
MSCSPKYERFPENQSLFELSRAELMLFASFSRSSLVVFLLFPEKEAKSVSSASQKITGPKTFREAEPRGFGGWPPKNDQNSRNQDGNEDYKIYIKMVSLFL